MIKGNHPRICGVNACPIPKIQLPNGVWICPAYYGSPMHYCSPHQFDDPDEARRKLEARAGLSLEAYLWFTNRWEGPKCPRCGKILGYVDGHWICSTPWRECGIMTDGTLFKVENMEAKIIERSIGKRGYG